MLNILRRTIYSDTRSHTIRKGGITSSSTSPVKKTFFIEDRTAAVVGLIDLFLVQLQLGSQFRLRAFTMHLHQVSSFILSARHYMHRARCRLGVRRVFEH